METNEYKKKIPIFIRDKRLMILEQVFKILPNSIMGLKKYFAYNMSLFGENTIQVMRFFSFEALLTTL